MVVCDARSQLTNIAYSSQDLCISSRALIDFGVLSNAIQTQTTSNPRTLLSFQVFEQNQPHYTYASSSPSPRSTLHEGFVAHRFKHDDVDRQYWVVMNQQQLYCLLVFKRSRLIVR